MAGLPVQQAITAAEAINQLFATGSGTVAGTADALNSINGAVGASNLSATQILNGIGATAGITNVGATSVNMFQQFAADSAEAGVLASKVAGVAAVVGLFSNVGLIYTQSTDSKGIQTNTVISTIGSALGVLALTAAAPEVALALGVAAAGLTLYGLKDQGSLAQTVANLQSVIAPYFNSLSPANQSAFTATFSQTTQSVLSGGMLVPTVDNNGMISGYSVQIPTSVVTQTDGSTVSYFSGNVAYVQQPAAGSNAVSSASGSQLQGEWTIPQANNGTAQINTYADGSYTQSAVDAKGNQVSLQSNAATPGVLSIETSGTSTSGSKIDQNETLQINSNSSKTDDLKNLNGNGTIQNEQVITTQANGQASAILSGTGAATTLSNAAVTISAGSTASVIGNGNTISVGTGGTLTVTSSGNGLANTVNVSTGTVTNVSANTDVNFHSTQGSNVVNGTGAGAVINDVSAGNNTINMQTAGQTVGVNTVGVETVNASTQDTTYVSGTSYVNFHSSQGNNTVTGVASGAVINDVSAGNNTINMQTAGQTVGVNTVGVETVNASTQDTTYVSGTSYVNFHSSQGNNTVTGVASGAVINDVSAGNNTINMQTAGQTVGVNTVGVETVNASTQDTTYVSGTSYVNFHSSQGNNTVTGVASGAVINDVSAGNNTINMQTAGQTVGVNTVGVETVNASTQDTTYVSGTSYVNFHSSQGNNTVTGVASGAVINDVSAGNNTINMQTAGQTVGVNTTQGVETINASTHDTAYVSSASKVNVNSTPGSNNVVSAATGASVSYSNSTASSTAGSIPVSSLPAPQPNPSISSPLPVPDPMPAPEPTTPAPTPVPAPTPDTLTPAPIGSSPTSGTATTPDPSNGSNGTSGTGSNGTSGTGSGSTGASGSGSDESGSSGGLVIETSGTSTSGGNSDGGGGGGGGGGGVKIEEDPIILNLRGAAVQTIGMSNSSAYFDMQNNGQKVQTGWATAGEGILVYDPNNTNTVTQDANLVAGFGALSALANQTGGVLDASNPLWNELKVWVDPTGTGSFQQGQLETLGQLGITSINLNSTAENVNSNGNTILNDSTFTWNNGTTGDIAGVDLAFNPNAVMSSTVAGSTPSTTLSGSLNHLIQSMAAFTDGNTGIDPTFSSTSANIDTFQVAASHAVQHA